MKKSILALITLFSLTAHADEGFFGFGVGLANSAKNSRGEVKLFNGGIREDLFQGIYLQGKFGYWGDGSGDPNRSGSLFVSAGPGFLVDLSPLEIRTGWSLAMISTPDGYLGGRFPQFNGEIYVGLRDYRGNGVGLQYDHISSAGLVNPNAGRDFFTLQVSQRF